MIRMKYSIKNFKLTPITNLYWSHKERAAVSTTKTKSTKKV